MSKYMVDGKIFDTDEADMLATNETVGSKSWEKVYCDRKNEDRLIWMEKKMQGGGGIVETGEVQLFSLDEFRNFLETFNIEITEDIEEILNKEKEEVLERYKKRFAGCQGYESVLDYTLDLDEALEMARERFEDEYDEHKDICPSDHVKSKNIDVYEYDGYVDDSLKSLMDKLREEGYDVDNNNIGERNISRTSFFVYYPMW